MSQRIIDHLSKNWLLYRGQIDEAFYDKIVGELECGPFDGGCVITAKALQKVIGGNLVVLQRPDGGADHAAILKDQKLWDYNGPLPPSEFIERFNSTETPPVPVCSYRSLLPSDLPNASKDNDGSLTLQLSDLFKSIVTQAAKDCPPPEVRLKRRDTSLSC